MYDRWLGWDGEMCLFRFVVVARGCVRSGDGVWTGGSWMKERDVDGGQGCG